MGLFYQNYDKPSAQARAVMSYLDMYDGVEASWDSELKRYAPVRLAEWHNGRENGYVIMFHNAAHEQLNIAFFEHRNSDDICAVKWVQSTINPPTIETANFGEAYKTKYDVSHTVGVGHAMDMADWIMDQLNAHWMSAIIS